MKRMLALVVALALGPVPAMAQVMGQAGAPGFGDLAGRWRGEGQLTLDNEPPRRFRCQIRLRPVDARRAAFSGRCATAQGGQSFVYMLGLDGGAVLAENRSEPPDDLPSVMRGDLSAGTLRFADAGGALFELSPHAEGLTFRLEGDGPEGFARGAVVLRRQGEGD